MLKELKKKPSLRLALIAYVIVPLMLAVGAISYIALHVFEHHIKERMEEDVELVARAIRLPLSRALERDRVGSMEETLESAFSINRVYGAYVYDANGEMISAAGGGNVSPDRSRLTELAESGDRQGGYEEISGRAIYSYFVPLMDSGGRSNGLLQVTRRASDIEGTVERLRWEAAGFLVVALMLMIGLVLYGHHGAIGKHLSRLGKSMARVERGDHAHRVPVRGPAEIAALGEGLNTMLDSIVRAEEEIQERRAAQASLERRLRHAEKLAAIGQLSAGVAHELGTPLSVIGGKAQRTLRREDISDGLASTLEDIRTEVQRMERIVRQLLDFGRRNTLQRRRITADRMAMMAANSVREGEGQNGAALGVTGPKPPPQLSVDPVLMERVLVNLLKNAKEATPEGRVRLSWFSNEENVGFVVEDDGPGIEEDHKSRLFEPFFTTKKVGEGTGLGLAVVHGIVEEHGGRVEVGTSELGGAAFTITIPRHVEQNGSHA